jgi:hypothetical protein
MKIERARASLPEGYVGSGELVELLEWDYVDERMQSARHYWLSTVSGLGAPHTRPVALSEDRAVCGSGLPLLAWCGVDASASRAPPPWLVGMR